MGRVAAAREVCGQQGRCGPRHPTPITPQVVAGAPQGLPARRRGAAGTSRPIAGSRRYRLRQAAERVEASCTLCFHAAGGARQRWGLSRGGKLVAAGWACKCWWLLACSVVWVHGDRGGPAAPSCCCSMLGVHVTSHSTAALRPPIEPSGTCMHSLSGAAVHLAGTHVAPARSHHTHHPAPRPSPSPIPAAASGRAAGHNPAC